METILRSKEMAEIIFLPIRHHSPACAWHVRKVIQKYIPSSILIEGPENANRLIPVLVHPDTKPPLALYYSYRDSMGLLSKEKEDYKCYYPFLDYSPELAALKEGHEQGIPAMFIDLPYGEILAASKQGRGLLKDGEKNNYNDDYLLTNNEYIRQLCKKTGMRSFDEFWEKYFELNGIYEDSETLFSHVFTYCRLARENTPDEVLKEDGCHGREAYMAERILSKAREICSGENEPGPILVITGGFHTPGLLKLIEERKSQEKRQNIGLKNGVDKGIVLSIPEKDQSVYPMPYSMEAVDALNGYASGMPFPEFYQQIWEGLGEEGPYRRAILDMIVKAGKETRKKEGSVSTYDEICACSMADGLAQLREKPEPGAYELLDAILSSFVKGEYNLSTDMPMQLIKKIMTGISMGVLCSGADVPPVIQDFDERCRQFGLKIHSTLEQEITLSIFSSQKHRQISMFFNRMAFLDTQFARKIKGPNLQRKKDRNLMREIWKYKWSAQVTSALIDVSVYGATMEEACCGILKKRLKKDMGAKEAAVLLTNVFEMGMREQLTPVYDRCYELMQRDTDFYSLAEALSYLMMLEELESLYHSGLAAGDLTGVCIHKLISLLPGISQVKEENLSRCMDACKLLYQVTGREQYSDEREQFYEILCDMTGKSDIHPGLHGCMTGVLYGGKRLPLAQVEHACQGYLTGTKEQMQKTAVFFRGLFFTARDLLFIGPQFLKMLDDFFGAVDDETFLELLPELKMAFSYFTPREIDRIAESAAGLHGKKKRDILELKEILPGWSSYGRELERYAREIAAGRKINGITEGSE